MSPRVKARLLGVVLPDFPNDLAPGDSLEVAVRFQVGADGQVDNVELTSKPSSIDSDVVNMVRKWFVVPAICSNSAWNASEVRTSLSFSREGDRKLVTVKDPRWYAIGEQVELRTIGESTQLPPLVLIHGENPAFSRALIRKGIQGGVVAVQIKIDVNGHVVEIPRIFSWPGVVFEEPTRSAMKQWKIGNADGTPLDQPVIACVEINFSLKR